MAKAKKVLDLHETPYGFNWGDVEVVRVAEIQGHKVLGINTPRRLLTVRITRTGLIRTEEHKR